MTNLEMIIGEIESAASKEAEEALAKARAEAEAILSAARDEASALAAETEAETARRVSEIDLAGDSARQRVRRERILETKQELINDVIGLVSDKLHKLPAPEYFALLIKLAVSAATSGEGLILLNDKDKKRLPQDFESKLSGMLPADARLSISGETRPIDGGLILKYSGVEQNCSFEAILNARRDEFSDMIHDTLFAG